MVTKEIVFTIPEAARRLQLSDVTVAKATSHLERLGVIHEATGRTRKKVFVYSRYLGLLAAGTEAPSVRAQTSGRN
jgi:hypothetical protein